MYKVFKRIIDIICSFIAIIVFLIPMIIVAICIKVEDGGPVFYKSKRVGKGCKLFSIYKFRSMKTNREELKGNVSHDQMVTKVGKFIRKTSLDELPQLFNVLKGDMSFIGPRPWIEEYYKHFNLEQKKRSDVLPGITGLAQAMGRNGISIHEKIAYDIEYVNNMSLKMDIDVIIKTVITVIRKDNAEISEQGIKEEIEDLKSKNNVNANNYDILEREGVV